LLLAPKQEIRILLSEGYPTSKVLILPARRFSQTKNRQSNTDASDKERVSASVARTYSRPA
jgi:hypothetical protein